MINTLIPTQLFIGNGTPLITAVETFIQKTFCTQGNPEEGCFCTSCRQIKNRQHPHLLWLKPERDYKVQDLEPIFASVTFALNNDDHYYIVFEHAESFNHATANRLLKVLEEPPAGYNFILMTDNEDALLETIRSRCHVIRIQQLQSDDSVHPLLSFFLLPGKQEDPFSFEQLLKKLHLSDTQSIQLANQLMHQLSQKIISHYQTNQENSAELQHQLHIVQKALLKPPQSGSSELFWKQLYLQYSVCA